MEVKHVTFSNKSAKKIRAEVRYNANNDTLTFVVYDRVGTVYIDANPNKEVNIEARWIVGEGEEMSNESGPEQQPTSTSSD